MHGKYQVIAFPKQHVIEVYRGRGTKAANIPQFFIAWR